jgi:alpha-L-rhamnosidase
MGYENKRDMYGKKTRVAISLRLEYADGSVDTVQSSPEWKATAGPTTAADLLMGESYDARKELRGWTAGGFDDSAWIPVDVGTDEVHPVIQWHPGPPVRPYETFAPLHTNEVSPGVWVMDLGQNFAGFARLKLPDTTPGQKITLRFAERLNPDGTIYTLNLRGARATDTYICRGAREEDWQPRFTFHGFQYIEVTGLSRPPQRDTVTGVAIGSDTPLAGTFDTSDAMLNRLHKNIYYTQRSNFIDVPTDCPQRDERLGWMADAQVYVQAAALNTDVHAFMDKWLIDIMDAQRKRIARPPIPIHEEIHRILPPALHPGFIAAQIICQFW